jgi:hypothetical protein
MIKFPEMRKEMFDRIQLLADRTYQKKWWGKTVPHVDFGYVVAYLYDMSLLAEYPYSQVGYVLENDLEVSFITDVCNNINYLYNKYGKYEPDEFYMNTPEWNSVVKAAENFWNYLKSIDESIEKHKFKEPLY